MSERFIFILLLSLNMNRVTGLWYMGPASVLLSPFHHLLQDISRHR
jgi:hypothetical protein